MHPNGNGNGKPPIPFASAAAQIPIIGQAFQFENWFVTLILTCRCERPTVVTVVGVPGTAAGQCKSCGKVYALQSLGVDAAGRPQFQMGMGQAPLPSDPPVSQE